MSYGQQKPWSGMYMQHSTYSHDFSQLGISPRQRPGDNVYNASVRADIPAGTYRPTMYDQMESPRREEAQQRYDYRGDLTERRIPKRGTEWIGGRRYDNEPREGRHDMYERQRRIDMSPERMFNREFEIGIPYKERPLETLPYATNIRRRQTFTQGDAPRFNQNFNRKPKDAFDPYGFGRYTSIGQECSEEFDLDAPYMYRERQYDSLPYINPQRRFLVNQDYNYNYGRHTSIGQEASRDYGQVAPHRSKQPEPLPPLDAKQNKHWMIHDDDIDKTYDRGRNGSPERIDRGRNGSPERERKFDQVREPNERHNRYIDKDKNRHIYPAWYDYPRETARDKYDERYEKPRDQIMDGYANHKMSDRTTQKDYGEFMLEKIKQDELRRNLDYPRQEAPAAQSGGVYLFIRTDKGALTEIRKALQEGRSVLANSGGQLKGIAHSEQIALVQGNQGWNIQYNSAYIMIVFEFSKSKDAEEWLQSNHKLKNLYSPAVLDAFTAPINYRPTFDAIGNTFLMIEYPRVIQEKIRNEFIPKVQALLRKFYDFDDKLPVMAFGYDGGLEIKHLGGYWVRPKSTLICLRFKSRNEAIDFWQNSEFREAQEDIRREIERRPWFSTDQLFHPTAVIFSFTETKV